MKKLITTDLGGQPVYFKDFEFIQEQIRELLGATYDKLDSTKVTVLNSATFDLSTDGYTLDVLTAGWAYYAGEYFYIPVHSATGSGTDVPKWNIVETYDSRGLKTFSDTGVGDKDVYLVRQLHVSYVPPASGGVLYSETEAIPMATDWVNIAAQSPWSSGSFYYRLNELGHLEIHGACTATVSTAVDGVVIFVLPEGFRPSGEVLKSAAVQYNTGRFAQITYATNGEVIFYSDDIADPILVGFQHTVFLNWTN